MRYRRSSSAWARESCDMGGGGLAPRYGSGSRKLVGGRDSAMVGRAYIEDGCWYELLRDGD